MNVGVSDVLDALRTLALDGEASTAERLATHIGLVCQGAEPTATDIEKVINELVVEGKVREWRVFASGRRVEAGSDWIIAFVPA